MLTAFGHMENLGLAESSRNAHNEEFSDDELTTTTLPNSAIFTWKQNNVQHLEVNTMIISTELAGSSFLTCTYSTLPEIGTLSTQDGNCSLSLRMDETKTILIVVGTFTGKSTSRFTIQPGDEWRWVEPLFATVTASKVIVLDTVLATKVPLVSAAQGRPTSPYLYQLGTTTFVKDGGVLSHTGDSITCDQPKLPNAILLEGFSGALMSHCESTGMNGVALISLIDRVVDSTTLVAYESCFFPTLNNDSEPAMVAAAKTRRDVYKNAVKGTSNQLDSMYL